MRLGKAGEQLCEQSCSLSRYEEEENHEEAHDDILERSCISGGCDNVDTVLQDSNRERGEADSNGISRKGANIKTHEDRQHGTEGYRDGT